MGYFSSVQFSGLLLWAAEPASGAFGFIPLYDRKNNYYMQVVGVVATLYGLGTLTTTS